jgi:hypothetical protein
LTSRFALRFTRRGSVKLPPPHDVGDAAYDAAARSLAAEARGAAGDRTLTAQELECKEAERLEALERDRCGRDHGLRLDWR